MATPRDYLFHPDRNPLFREEYRPLDYKIPRVDLKISLDEEKTLVKNTLLVELNKENPKAGGPLILDGENLALTSLRILENNQWRALDPAEFLATEKQLIIKQPPAHPFSLEISTEINPKKNTELQGLYTAGDILCTQCEAQGFRRISYMLDRPDNLAVYSVTLDADKEKFPVLLSNGNGDYKQTQDIGEGRHAVSWQDPWPKPSYLFAVVAGDLKVLEDSFTTMSGKEVALRIFVQEGYEDKIAWAMESTKRAMKWDEEKYGREYDLDMFHIVAVDKFNAGAMENKGLNVFNVSYLVGDQYSSTDAELVNIERVIGHEYFHNYSGDRVTVRDWFELTLKEGFTVLRDRQFTADMHSAATKTISDATGLRTAQFMEDSSPNAHPIRPDRVEEFDNIYTGTIYQKGSHVLGMLRTILGDDTWRAGTDEYFSRFDGKAVTCDDFVDVMQDVSGRDLSLFRRWYSQSGTPEVSYDGKYDAHAKTYTLTLTQNTPATADQSADQKQTLYIPVAVGLISESGKDVPLQLQGDKTGFTLRYSVACKDLHNELQNYTPAAEPTKILHLTQEKQTFVFENVEGPVVPSVLRSFSAPVKITTQPSDDELFFRMAHDSDPFNKFEAAERMSLKTIRNMMAAHKAGEEMIVPQAYLDAYALNLQNALEGTGDKAFFAQTLSTPAYSLIIQGMQKVDPDAVDAAVTHLRKTLANTFHDELETLYKDTAAPNGEKYNVVPAQTGRRSLHNFSLSLLNEPESQADIQKAAAQYKSADNMTEKAAALGVLAFSDTPERTEALEDFYKTYKNNPTIIDRWFSLQAAAPFGDAVGRVRQLMQHEDYDITNPNRVRAVIGGFVGMNPTAFHKKDGSGYALLADVVIQLNTVNPRTGAALAKALTQFGLYEDDRRTLMVKELQRIAETPQLNSGISEIVGNGLKIAKATQPAISATTPKHTV